MLEDAIPAKIASMNAKQTCVTLFVRIPLDLKQRVGFSASVRGASLAKEVVRLLEERLQYSLPANLEALFKAHEASLYKGQLDRMEALVLHYAANSDGAAGAKQLRRLAEMILEMQREREQAVQVNARRRKEQEDFLTQRTQRVPAHFAALLRQNDDSYPPQHFDKEERRRINLTRELQSRGRGTKARLAGALNYPPAYLSQMLSEPSNAGHRKIKGDVARAMEAALGLKCEALDKDGFGSGVVEIQRAADELKKALNKN